MFHLNNIAYNAPDFLHALAETLLGIPGGWGGVAEDLKDVADNHVMVIRNEVWSDGLFEMEYDGVMSHDHTPSLVPHLLQEGWVQNKNQPIMIHNGKIVDGWRRVQALKRLGWGRMRVNIQTTTLEG